MAGTIATLLGGLYKAGMLSMPGKQYTQEKWNGTERRECAQHGGLTQKVCALYEKLNDIDKKLDRVAEKLQYVLGSLRIKDDD